MDSMKPSRRGMIVTIDGPAGAGKTSVSKLLAHRLGYRYLDTGALYRAVAVAAMQAGIASDDDAALEDLCRRISLDLQETKEGLRILLNQKDITDLIRAPEISMVASAVSARPVIRAFLLQTQRDLGAQGGVVAEGRDMGTVVFPHAEAKFFLDADSGIRAKRRYEELKTLNMQAPSLEVVQKDMAQRDHNDATRPVAPLQAAADAIVIDSTLLALDEVVSRMLDHIDRIA